MTDKTALYRAHVARSALTADPYDPNDYPWVDKPWLECPPALDLSASVLSIEDQLTEGSCVSNSLTTKCEALKRPPAQLSRQYHYFRGRSVSPATAPPKDGGMTLKQGMQAAKAWGICREPTWPYNPAAMNDTPSAAADAEAAAHRVTRYERIKAGAYVDYLTVIRRIKEALTLGFMVQLGIQLEESFFYLKGPCNGQPYPYGGLAKAGAVLVGGHAMAIVGYYQRGSLDYFKVANSWGTSWGDGGYALLSMYVVAGADAMDMWAVTEFDGAAPPAADLQQAHTFISRLYVALFGRAPDAEGLAYWTGQYTAGSSLAEIAAFMFGVQPARAYYPVGATPEDVTRSFYYNVLGRAPDADALAYWAGRIRVMGEGAAIQELVAVTANYTGSDVAGALSCDRFNRRVRAGRLFAEAGGGIVGATAAIQFIE